ncbi:MAG: hypothetical protein ACI9W4_002652 [Rhodothermales bacterium]|jgi:hypothetical protein
MTSSSAFFWDDDVRWQAYTRAFLEARKSRRDQVEIAADRLLDRLGLLIKEIANGQKDSSAAVFASLEEAFFEAAPLVAVCRDRLPRYQESWQALRAAVKRQSIGWDMSDSLDRRRLYRLLYGSRAAIEEAVLQGPGHHARDVVLGSAALNPAVPTANLFGVQIQSGDILLSRGGAAVSALIARGNDYSSNFSHVALARVHQDTGEASVIEAHIARGVMATDATGYLKDKKMRFLVLRVRSDLPALLAEPQLPHLAAEAAWAEAHSRHIPYDFQLDWTNSDRMFCSEVVSSAYQALGLRLWMAMSSISNPGLKRWLGLLGVTFFETQEPGDIAYDPQLAVVAEWADPDTLWKDHLDSVVTDVLLEGAERGDDLPFFWWKAVVVGPAKALSWLLNMVGRHGPVPEGMGVITALRVAAFSKKHAALVVSVDRRATAFEAEHGHRPAYWELLELARPSRPESRG